MFQKMRDVLDALLAVLKKVSAVLDETLVVLRLTMRLLKYCVFVLTVRPTGFGTLVQTGEVEVAKIIKYTHVLGLLALTAEQKAKSDKQRIRVSEGGVEQPEQLLGLDDTSVTFTVGPKNTEVVVTRDLLDADGNDSDDVSFPFVVQDKTAPPTPEGFGEMTQTGEVEVDVPDEEVPVDVPDGEQDDSEE